MSGPTKTDVQFAWAGIIIFFVDPVACGVVLDRCPWFWTKSLTAAVLVALWFGASQWAEEYRQKAKEKS